MTTTRTILILILVITALLAAGCTQPETKTGEDAPGELGYHPVPLTGSHF